MPLSCPSILDDAAPDAVIAGTLCLMSCYVQHPVPAYAERVAENLARMARLPLLTPELRTICCRLAERWDGIRDGARLHPAAGATAGAVRAMH